MNLTDTTQKVMQEDKPFEALVLHSRLGDIYAINLPEFNRHDRRIILSDHMRKADRHMKWPCSGASKALPDAQPRNKWPKKAASA